MARKLVRKAGSKTAAPEPPVEADREIEYDFIKSNFFRVVKLDGAFGGLAPNGSFHMSVFNERQAIPTKVVHKLISGTGLGPEITAKREARKAIIREVEVDLVFDVTQAIALRTWLDDKIKQYQLATAAQAKGKGEVH